MAMTDVDTTDAAAPDGRGLGGKTVAPWDRACGHETSRRGGGVRERRVGEGERGERRGGDRKGGRSLGVRRHAQQIGSTPTRASTR